ncbi:MAG: phosphoribosylanthranilate isomerase [Candidatus Aquicultorales bacterium]
MTKIKICGITNIEDALTAAALGADALGFVFAESPRRILPEAARSISSKMPPFLLKVGVFVDASADAMNRAVELCGLDAVQLHGEGLDPSGLPSQVRVFRVAKVADLSDVDKARRIEADAVLLDSKVKGLAGGTGVSFDWDLLTGVNFKAPLILSGGLDSDNVEDAVAKVRPYAVDASSGLEERPGKKDREKISRFIEAVRKADRKIAGLGSRALSQ